MFSKLVKTILAKSSLSDLFSITTKLLVHCSAIDVQLYSQLYTLPQFAITDIVHIGKTWVVAAQPVCSQ